jgi:PiT family inorganic phosphate transporter
VFIIFLSSGLFLGWSLGANDAANIFGTAVGSKMVSFARAAIIASIFVIIGAAIQGGGTTETLGSLGLIDELAGSFTVALAAGFTVFVMTKYGLPVSTTQAIVGAIIGWNLFAGRETDAAVLSKIVTTWISGPLLGAAFSALLFLLMRYVLRKMKIHMILLDSYIRWGLIAVGAFGAYSLGANNVANVIGVFVGHAPNIILDFGIFELGGTEILFLAGGVSIALGILTYSRKIIQTIGKGIMDISSEAAIVVVLAQSLVLFIFSSTTLSNVLISIGLPPIPLVPVSSSQVVVGAIIGIGLVKGIQEVRIKMLAEILVGWILTPIFAGLLSFFGLFFVQNVFNQEVFTPLVQSPGKEITSEGSKIAEVIDPQHVNLVWWVAGIGFILLMVLAIWLIIRQNKLKLIAQNELLEQQNEHYVTQKALMESDLKTMRLENVSMAKRLEFRRKELMNMALNIVEQKNYLEELAEQLKDIQKTEDKKEKNKKIDHLLKNMKLKMSFDDKVENFNLEIEKLHKGFSRKLEEEYPKLTETEKRFATFLRLGFSSKEIAPLLNVSIKSVETYRYRLRKKLNISKGENLIRFIQNL